MTQNKIIGRVLSVDNFRVYIRIEDELHGAYKSGFNDIYEVARINSYLIIPVGSDRVVALITRVTMKEELEFDKTRSSISLPSSARYISATMLGTITKQGDDDQFIQGVYNFPTLDNPVWYVTEKDLRHIFDDKQDVNEIDYSKDYYLPIGNSPVFSDYQVKICPDQFFVKHAAILGNTGSGKSCTLTSIIRNLFKYDYKGGPLKNAHIVIFDTNGEYKDAFLPTKDDFGKMSLDIQDELKRINSYYYGGEEKLKVPYWFMSWEDFNYLLKPSAGTQAPVLNRAIGLAKEEQESASEQLIPKNLIVDIESIVCSTSEKIKTRTGKGSFGNWEWKKDNEIYNIGEAVSKFNANLGNAIHKLSLEDNFNNADIQQPIRTEIEELLNSFYKKSIEAQITNEQNIDLPIWFNYQELCTKFIDVAIDIEGSSNNRIREFVSTLRLRMRSFLSDKRMAIPLMLKDTEEANKTILPQFISFILGDFNKLFRESGSSDFITEYNTKYNQNASVRNIEKTNQVNIIDVSQLPFEVLETVTALLGRIILEFVSHFAPENRGKYPIVIVLEEAQNYIAENRESIAKSVFERIAREGRKYGISLVVCSQRPSELSKTVLSQCNSFIIHRLQNPEDQKYIKGLVSSANADILDQLPIIPQQHAIVTGDCVKTPIQVRIDCVFPTPNSHNPKFIENWLSDKEIPYEETCERWIGKDD